MKRHSQGLKSSLILSSSGMLVITVLTLNFILGFIFYQYIERDILQKNNALVHSIKHEVSSFFKKTQQDILQMNDLIENNYSESHNIQQILDNALKYSDVFSNFFILDSSGSVLITSPQDSSVIGTDHSLYPYFKNVSSDSPLYFSKAFFTYNSKKPLVSISLKSKNKILVGIINLDALGTLVQELDLGKDNYITIIDSSGTYIAHTIMENVYQRGKDPFYLELTSNEFRKITYDGITMVPTIAKEDDQNWSILIYQSYSELISPIYQFIKTSLLFTLLLLIFSSFISYRRVSLLTSSINSFIAQTDELSAGHYQFSLEHFPYEELNLLKDSFTSMASTLYKRELDLKENEKKIIEINQSLEKKVEERTLDLEESNKNLSESLSQLKELQSQLVETEKLAALGELITGVAHELNTPIGVSITTVSYLELKRNELENSINSNKLKKSDLLKFLSINNSSLKTLNTNLKKSSDLIELFKQLSTKPDLSDRKNFNLLSELEIIKSTFERQLSENVIEINIECDRSIDLQSYKNSFDQVMIHLLQNVIAHAFEPPFSKPKKRIDILVKSKNKNIEILISDNGIGIPSNILERVLNPFFTTARGRGFNGLGLNIVYNIISTNLAGKLNISSKVLSGTIINIIIPRSI